MNLDSFENLASLRSEAHSNDRSADPPYQSGQAYKTVPKRKLIPGSDLM